MRILRLKLKKLVTAQLKLVSKQYRVEDSGFLEDVYSLLRFKGQGLPSAERIDHLADLIAKKTGKPKLTVRFLITKRKLILKKLASLPYFYALATVYSPIDATERLIGRFRQLYFKQRAAQCMTCALMSQCDFGKQYGAATTNIAAVVDPQFRLKVHDECPALPEIDFMNQLAIAAETMKTLTKKEKSIEQELLKDGLKLEQITELDLLKKEDARLEENESAEDCECNEESNQSYTPQGNAYGRCDTYDATHDGSNVCKFSENLVDSITAAQLAIFELGRVLSLGLASTKKGKFAPVVPPEKEKSVDTIQKISEVAQVLPSQHALPEKIFEQKMLKKQLVKSTNLKPAGKKQLLYMLCDASGSMRIPLKANKNLVLNRGVLASVLNLAVCRQVQSDDGIVFLRFFGGSYSRLYTARNKEEYTDLLFQIAQCSYNGGGTNIVTALTKAQKDISTAKDEMASAEILLITDCEDSFSEKEAKEVIGKVPLHILDVSGHQNSGAVSATLQKIATKYYKANETVNVNKLVELL